MTNEPPHPLPLSSEPSELSVAPTEAGHRLDAFLASHFLDYSRVHLRRVISAGGVNVDGRGGKPAYRLKAGQRVSIVLPEIPREVPLPENIPLDVLYQDQQVVVINKPAGMVVHPARGHWSGTLAGALQFHFGPTLSAAGGASRPGLVHRLDRDTSGVIVVARNDQAHSYLGKQFAARSVEKEYFALVAGCPERDCDVIDQPIGFHPRVREKMAIVREGAQARPAQTVYTVLERFDGFAALKLRPKTGRTHQIRVHLGHIGCPVLCDRQYGGRSRITRGEVRRDPADETVLLARQALHARRLSFLNPATGQRLTVEAPLPPDIVAVLEELRQWRAKRD